MPNRLSNATSPYLLQHADNPVDWHPWSQAALDLASQTDRPILLSVGYAACHWCHVMAHESFEDEETAALMNELFVNIKVDREERPDIDSIYMTALQAMTGSGGWPMTIFMTADGVPFYGGTYFPPEDRYQMPAFRRVLVSVADAYRQRRAELLNAGQQLVEQIREATAARMPAANLSHATLDEAYAVLHGQFDPERGGFSPAPKFPQPMVLEFLLRYATRSKHGLAQTMIDRTLHAMAEGGMYDQLGGGFHRYSVDAEWLVPHFEKMLYDNALLAHCYAEAYQASGDPFYRRIAEETLDYLVREMCHPDGGFYSSQDADSLPNATADHKHEGAFYVWTAAEAREALGDDAMAFAAVFDITDQGNFEGTNVLRVRRQPADVARVLGISLDEMMALVARGRSLLFNHRLQRPAPDIDDKVLTAWNGMALRAFAHAARAFGRDDYREIARANAEFLLRELRVDGQLRRSWRDQQTGDMPAPAFLDDYALLADGLLTLYEATFEERWLHEARALAETIVTEFWDEALGGFYDTAVGHEQLVVRPRDTADNATPSGSSVAADVLLRLALIFDVPNYRRVAQLTLESMVPFMERYPTGFGRYLAVAEFALGSPKEIALIGDPAATASQALLNEIFLPFIPHKVVIQAAAGAAPAIDSPLLVERPQLGQQPTVYVCQSYVCQLPVTDPVALRAQLNQL